MIFFTRHGESEANLADRELRVRPPDADRLSELGWAQARGVGERLRGEGIEVIVASHYRRAQETAQAISEVLGGLPIETDEDLHEVRQSDAYYAAAPHYGDTGTIRWMPGAERSFAEPGAESFDAILGRVLRVQERLAGRPEKRVQARSNPPHQKCDGLDLPRNRPQNVLKTRSELTRICRKRRTISGS